MVSKDDARAKIAELAEKYSQINKGDLKGYTEEDTKKDFLMPMFRALGWDMEDRGEVRAEEQIGTGFADYSFRINGVTNFYLEAKRFSADLNDKKFMQQAINYAYLKGVTWTVLSDFEQLMVFNANWEERDPLKSRFIDLTWEQYADDGFERLWLLSKPSLEAREIDAEAEKWGRKKTRARVTDVLFADLTKWRQALFRDIRGFSETLWSQDAAKVDEAIQRFLDRLIFVRTVEDRQIEENRLRALLRQYEKKRGGKKNLFQDLLALFRELDDIYNARLFAETTLDHLTVNDENLLRDIIDGLYDVKGGFANYDFSAMDADVLGAVYEQYLGFKAQDPKGEDAIDLRKSTKRKSQGIYYTPHFVVRYIVQQTLGKLLNTPDMTPEKAHTLRILDPACGSGSFLIEAFDVLDSWLAEHGDERDKKFPQQRKMRILQENIYGVDLDPQAVEVARLNLLLRAARERKLLPMLDNIKHGNSLIDDPAVAGDAAFDWGEQFREVFESDELRPLWFVTFVTHNSRVSERMVEFGIKTGEPLVFTPDEQIAMAEAIADAIQRYGVPVVTWNVLPDHVHMVIAADDETALNELVRKIKGYSSYAYKRPGQSTNQTESASQTVGDSNTTESASQTVGLKPTVSKTQPTASTTQPPVSETEAAMTMESGAVWARKFNRIAITDEAMLYNVIEYIDTNAGKHAETWGDTLLETDKVLQRLVQPVCLSPEDAARVPGGFDVVIGNPPYVQSRSHQISEIEKIYYENAFSSAQYQINTYGLFVEKGINLLHPKGISGVIIPNYWLSTGDADAALRKLTMVRNKTTEIINVYRVFHDATVDTLLLFVERDLSDSFPKSIGVRSINRELKSIDDRLLALNNHNWNYEDSYIVKSDTHDPQISFWEVLKLQGEKTLNDYLEFKFGMKPYQTGKGNPKQTEKIVESKPFNAQTKLDEDYYPLLFAADVKRYSLGWHDEWIKYGEHLAEPRNLELFQGERILLNRIVSRRQVDAAYADATYICNTDVVTLKLKEDKINDISLLFFLGLLASTPCAVYLRTRNVNLDRQAFPKINTKTLSTFPVPLIDLNDPADVARHDRMVSMVERMLTLKQDHAAAESTLDDKRHDLARQIERLDGDIDALVYELYGLTDEEIAIVEGTES